MRTHHSSTFTRSNMRSPGVALCLCIAACVVISSHASTVDWGSLSTNTLQALPTSAFAAATAEDIGDIPQGACGGFQASQIAAIPPSALSGISTQACMGGVVCFVSIVLIHCVRWLRDRDSLGLHW